MCLDECEMKRIHSNVLENTQLMIIAEGTMITNHCSKTSSKCFCHNTTNRPHVRLYKPLPLPLHCSLLFSSLSFLPSSLIPSITASSGGVNNWCSSSGTVRNLWIDGAEGGLYFSLLNFSVDLLGLIYLSTPRSTKVYILKKMDYRGKTLVFWPGQHFQCQDAFWSSPAPRHPFLTVHISVLVCVDMPYILHIGHINSCLARIKSAYPST